MTTQKPAAQAQHKPAPQPVKAAVIPLPSAGQIVYQWTGAGTAPYKNERLAYWQSKLRQTCKDKGYSLSNNEVKLYVMQSIQENGAIDPLHVTGDRGKAVGLPQRNVGNARSWLAKNPEWQDWQVQYDWWSDKTCSDVVMFRDRGYSDPVKFAIIYHNRPKSALEGHDQCLAGPTDYDDANYNDCYFKDQVKGRAVLLTP